MEKYFNQFRKNIIGIDQKYTTPYGTMKLLYADWIASGRLYRPIEERMLEVIGPFVANTHTETSETGTLMTNAYHLAHQKIKDHVNAGADDLIVTTGFGMTACINKLQRIIGLKFCGLISNKECLNIAEKPVVFVTHMEHHSNHTSWYETNADVVILPPADDLTVSPENLRIELEKYKNRKTKIGSFTACSNVSGVFTPYHELAKIMHKYSGICIIDFAASAPYVDINMHPDDKMAYLDAITFSPHKFLGGPGTSGVLIFNTKLYNTDCPDTPGGGTVDWTNRWGEYKYVDSIEAREDGGTPGFLQAIRTALAIELKNKMGTENIRKREEQLLEKAFPKLRQIPNLHILADNIENRLGVISFYIDDVHFNLVVKLLSDRYGIQMRGGCACAGTYGHYLLNIQYEHSRQITDMINKGDFSTKPGWARLSLHPTMTDEELDFIIEAIDEIAKNAGEWGNDYNYNKFNNEYTHKNLKHKHADLVKLWFDL